MQPCCSVWLILLQNCPELFEAWNLNNCLIFFVHSKNKIFSPIRSLRNACYSAILYMSNWAWVLFAPCLWSRLGSKKPKQFQFCLCTLDLRGHFHVFMQFNFGSCSYWCLHTGTVPVRAPKLYYFLYELKTSTEFSE